MFPSATFNHGIRRVTVIALDSVGAGVMPVHPRVDDGANTLGNTAWWYRQRNGKPLPFTHLRDLGLANAVALPGIAPVSTPQGAYGRLAPQSVMTDTITGHWELMGQVTGEYPASRGALPSEFVAFLTAEIKKRTGQDINFIGGGINISGTEVLKMHGAEARDSGMSILYTSADSVVQIAYHVGYKQGAKPASETRRLNADLARGYLVVEEEVRKMNRLCELIRQILNESQDPKHHYLRVISRPFASKADGKFERISSLRKDHTLAVPGKTLLDLATSHGLVVGSVGKIHNIFTGQGIDPSRVYPPLKEDRHLQNNGEGQQLTSDALSSNWNGILFVNLVDFDELYGHRNDPDGYADALLKFNFWLGLLKSRMRDTDVVIISADHGNDPTRGRSKWYAEQSWMSQVPGLGRHLRSRYAARGTDHTREYVPLVVFGNRIRAGANLGIRHMADVGATIAEMFGIRYDLAGTSFLASILA